MNISLASLILISVVFLAAAFAIAAFVWAIRNKQFKDLNAGAFVIFDEEEPIGEMTDTIFGDPDNNGANLEKEKGKK